MTDKEIARHVYACLYNAIGNKRSDKVPYRKLRACLTRPVYNAVKRDAIATGIYIPQNDWPGYIGNLFVMINDEDSYKAWICEEVVNIDPRNVYLNPEEL